MWCSRKVFCFCLCLNPLHNEVVGGGSYIGFTASVWSSVHPSARPAYRVRFVTPTVVDGCFPYWARMITSMKGCVVHNDIWPWPVSSKSFSHDFAIKLLKYDTSCRDHYTASTVLDGLFPYLTQTITSLRGCVVCNDLWPWPTYSRLLSCDVAYFMDHIHMWHKCYPWGYDASRTISRSKVKVTWVNLIFAVGAGRILVDHWSTIFSYWCLHISQYRVIY